MLRYTIVAIIPMVLADWDKEQMSKSQKELVDILREEGFIKDNSVAEAMSAVDVKLYEESTIRKFPALAIIMFYTYAYVLETLKSQLDDGSRALHVAMGSGYLTVCMAHMVGKNGYVVGSYSSIEELKIPRDNIVRHHSPMLETGQIKLVEKVGCPGKLDYGPYDAIHVAIVDHIVTKELLDQLMPGGRMLVPMKDAEGLTRMRIYDKDYEENVTMTLGPASLEGANLK